MNAIYEQRGQISFFFFYLYDLFFTVKNYEFKIQFYNRYAEDELCLYLLYVYVGLFGLLGFCF